MSVVIMDDPVMLVAAREGLITPITVERLAEPRQARARQRPSGRHVGQLPDALGRHRLLHQGRRSRRRAGPTSGRPAAAGKVIIPSLRNTEGYWALLAACASRDRQALQGSAIRDRRRLQEARDAEAEPAQRLHRRAAGDKSARAGRGVDDRRPVLGLYADPQGGGLAGRSRDPEGRRLRHALRHHQGEERPGRRRRRRDRRHVPRARKCRACWRPRRSSRRPIPTRRARPAIPIPATLFAPDWAFFAKERGGWVDRWNQI